VDPAVKRLGANVRRARQERGWTQEDLAAAADMAPVQISRIERGVREIRLTTLTRLLRALGIPADELLRGTF
jgi:transcriptional regulator with XRE-family HTH domain